MKFGSVEFFKALIKASLIIMPICLILLIVISISFAVYYKNSSERIRDLENRLEQVEVQEEDTSSDANLKSQEISLDRKSQEVKYYEISVSDHSNKSFASELTSGRHPLNAGSSGHTDILKGSRFDYLPDFWLPAVEIEEAPEKKTAYLTFDDGPSPITLEILDTLDDYGIKATFFVVSRREGYEKDILREVAARGHIIGMHSDSHDPQKIYQSVNEYLDDLYANYQYINELTGQKPQIYRFIGGSKSMYNNVEPDEIIAAMSDRGFSFFDWNSSAEDAVRPHPDARQIVNNVLKTADKQQLVVLAHDSGARKETARALPDIIEELIERGYEFDQLDASVNPVRFRQ